MADIFISYSSTDRGDAEQLMEQLTSAGLSVWLDKHGIDTATNWSREIVQAIDECKVMILLLSKHSTASHNVIKEVSLASEKRKHILPIDLEPITLPRELEYQLAGIQRASIANMDSIIHALGELGHRVGKDEGGRMKDEGQKEDARKTLMILPFDDLSPTADNQWFADGIVSEMITALSNVKMLRVSDAQMTKEYRNYKGQLTEYAREMRIRYFVQGDIRKFGDQIKITSRLLDTGSGEYVWQESMKGTMQDIFEIQETVAKNVLEGLHVILTEDERRKLDKRPTAQPEAYELWMRGQQYFWRFTKADCEHALALYKEAVAVDPDYVSAFGDIANVYQTLYREYERDPAYLERAEEASEKVKELEGETAGYYWTKSMIARAKNDFATAKRYALRIIELGPSSRLGYESLGYSCYGLGEYNEAAEAFEHVVRIRENYLPARTNFLISLEKLGDPERLRAAAIDALPVYERHLRLNPDDLHNKVLHATVLSHAGRNSDAIREADAISSTESLDTRTLYNLACIYLKNNHLERGFELLQTTIANNFANIDTLRSDPDLDPLRGTPEFEALITALEEKIAKGGNG